MGIFVKMHMWIWDSMDFNQANCNEDRTVWYGIERSGCKLKIDYEKGFEHQFQSLLYKKGLGTVILGFAFNGDDGDDL